MNIKIKEEGFEVTFADQKVIMVPWNYSKRLHQASLRQRKTFRITINGIHWPEVDEDLSFKGIRRDLEK